MTKAASPTLSDMDFDAFASDLPKRPTVSSSPAHTVNVTLGNHQPCAPSRAQTKAEEKPRMTRYLPDDGRDAFIGPMLPTAGETIQLVKRECPSLRDTPPEDISLNVRFDGQTTAIKNVLFRVTDVAWPGGVTDVLPLVHVSVRPRHLPSPLSTKKEKTWGELKEEKALLGIC